MTTPMSGCGDCRYRRASDGLAFCGIVPRGYAYTCHADVGRFAMDSHSAPVWCPKRGGAGRVAEHWHSLGVAAGKGDRLTPQEARRMADAAVAGAVTRNTGTIKRGIALWLKNAKFPRFVSASARAWLAEKIMDEAWLTTWGLDLEDGPGKYIE